MVVVGEVGKMVMTMVLTERMVRAVSGLVVGVMVEGAGGESYLQQSWKLLSGLPSDSDLMWTISHTAVPSPSAWKIHLWD